MQMLFSAHSGLRFLVLLAAIVALLYFGYAAATKRAPDRTGQIIGSIFTGLLDLQGLLGIIMVALGLFYGALMGHIFTMILALATAHITMKMGKSNVAKGNAIRFAGVLIALLLIVGGIMSIGRSVFGTGSPTLIQ
jgi:hypothetical protein